MSSYSAEMVNSLFVEKLGSEAFIIEMVLTMLKWLASKSSNQLDDKMVEVVEKNLRPEL